VKESLFRIDVKRWRLLAMERTESFVGASGSLQRDVLLDDRQEVRLKAQIIDKRLWKKRHQINLVIESFGHRVID
jgi:hypothetical protein